MRKTNVYEEKSLAIYSDAESILTDNDQGTQTRRNDLWYHIQKQLSFDLWYIVLGTFLIALAESNHFPLLSVLFEVVSAYGTVGLSLGYAWTESSLCSQFRDVSKLVILAMQVRGRHRGLPYALDHAVMLPYELHQDESEDENEEGNGFGWRRWIRRRRSDLSSLLSVTDTEENEPEPLLG